MKIHKEDFRYFDFSNFVLHWTPTCLEIGLYNNFIHLCSGMKITRGVTQKNISKTIASGANRSIFDINSVLPRSKTQLFTFPMAYSDLCFLPALGHCSCRSIVKPFQSA